MNAACRSFRNVFLLPIKPYSSPTKQLDRIVHGWMDIRKRVLLITSSGINRNDTLFHFSARKCLQANTNSMLVVKSHHVQWNLTPARARTSYHWIQQWWLFIRPFITGWMEKFTKKKQLKNLVIGQQRQKRDERVHNNERGVPGQSPSPISTSSESKYVE